MKSGSCAWPQAMLLAIISLLTNLLLGPVQKVGAVTSERSAIEHSISDHPGRSRLIAQASGFEYEDFDFWAEQCLFLSAETDYAKTLETCEKAISLRPRDNNLELWVARSQALFRMGEYAEAIGSFGQVVAIAPKDSLSIAYQCAALYQLSRLETAVDTCEDALRIDGNWGTESPAIAWYYQGLTLQAMGRLETALGSYERALTTAPDDLTLIAGRCALAAELGLFDDCSLAEAVTAYEQVLAETPEDATLWFQQGFALEQLGRFEQAATAYAEVIALNPESSRALVRHCAVLNEIGDYEGALAACDAALAGNGHWGGLGPVFAWSQRSAALIGLEEYEMALVAADRAIAIDETYPGGWNNRAVSLWHLENLDAAQSAILTACKRIEDIVPLFNEKFERAYPEPPILFYRSNAITDYNQGAIMLALHQRDVNQGAATILALHRQDTPRCPVHCSAHCLAYASAAYHRVIDLNKEWQNKLVDGTFLDSTFLSNLQTNYAVVNFYTGATHPSHLEEAVEIAATIANNHRDSFDAWLNLGVAATAVSNYQRAREAYTTAAMLDPERLAFTEIEYILGQSALEKSEYLNAWDIYTAAALQDPTRADAVVGQGLALQGLGLGCKPQAIEVFERALNLDASHRVAQEQHAQLVRDSPSSREADPASDNCSIKLR